MTEHEAEVKSIPLWVDLLSALWIAIAALSFIIKILVDTQVLAEDMLFAVVIGQYAYAAMVAACVVGVGLAVVRNAARKD